MKTRFILSFILALSPVLCALSSLEAQVPQGFNYQAIARDGVTGNPITNSTIKVKLSVLNDTTGFYLNGGVYQWEEEHTGVKTDPYGMFTVVLGDPSATRIQGALSFQAINWSLPILYIGTKVAQAPGYIYKIMGASRLWSVPYSLASSAILGDLGKLSVIGNNPSLEDALFEVKNFNGKTVFAVYNEGVRIYVDDGSKGVKGGFAIGGFDAAKQSPVEYLRVTRDSTVININQNSKGSKGGFAIGGFSSEKKSEPENFMNVTPDNTFIGYKAGYSNTEGEFNSFIGYQSGFSNTTGNNNIFLGNNAGYLNTEGTENIFIGTLSGYNNVGSSISPQGSYNIFMGTSSGHDNVTGLRNVFIGYQSGAQNISGESNIFLGIQSGMKNTSGSSNIFIGPYTGYENIDGVNNIYMGNMAGHDNKTGGSNIYIGSQSGELNQTGSENVIMGHLAGRSNNGGSNNSIIGTYAAANRITGNNNVIMGSGSGQYASTGSNNVFIGAGSGMNNGGNGNIFIGYNAGIDETGNNKLVIHNSSGGSTTALIYGDFENRLLNLNASVKINDVLKLQPRTTPPSVKEEGDMYYDSTDKKLKVWDGTAWRVCW